MAHKWNLCRHCLREWFRRGDNTGRRHYVPNGPPQLSASVRCAGVPFTDTCITFALEDCRLSTSLHSLPFLLQLKNYTTRIRSILCSCIARKCINEYTLVFWNISKEVDATIETMKTYRNHNLNTYNFTRILNTEYWILNTYDDNALW